MAIINLTMQSASQNRRSTQQGFTLVELVMVIILLAIVGTFSSKFISTNVVLFQESVNQNERLNDARFILNRMGKELDSAMAFSVRESGNCIRFIPFNVASRYIGQATGKNNIKLIMDAESREKGIGLFLGQRLGIYNTVYSDFADAPTIMEYKPSGASTTHADMTLSTSLGKDSPSSRYFIFQQEISYCLEGNSLYRYNDAVSTTTPTDSRVLMMNSLSDDSSMRLTLANAFSNAIVVLDFGFTLRDGKVIRFQHQVVMNNVP